MFKYLVVSLVLVYSTIVLSQDSGESEEKPKVVDKKEQRSPASKKKSVREIFVPSEEVSEDSSVSFPADI